MDVKKLDLMGEYNGYIYCKPNVDRPLKKQSAHQKVSLDFIDLFDPSFSIFFFFYFYFYFALGSAFLTEHVQWIIYYPQFYCLGLKGPEPLLQASNVPWSRTHILSTRTSKIEQYHLELYILKFYFNRDRFYLSIDHILTTWLAQFCTF